MTQYNFVFLLLMKLLSTNSAEFSEATVQAVTTEVPTTIEPSISPSITVTDTTAEQIIISRAINVPSVPTTKTPGDTSAVAKILPAAAIILVILLMMFIASISILIYLVLQSKDQTKRMRLSESFEMSHISEPELVGLKENCESVPPAIFSLPSQLNPIEGEEVQIEVKVEGDPPPNLAWYHNGEAILTDDSVQIDDQGSLLFQNIQTKHSGVYKIVATNEFGDAKEEVRVSVMSEGCEGGGDSVAGGRGKPIPVAEFGNFVSQQHADRNKEFRKHFERLSSGESGHSVIVSVSAENVLKNRFKNITTYDDNQIVLKPLGTTDGLSDQYINASYINGYLQSKRFIATQGPLPHTVVDFWRMVWQERPSAIVMLTNCEERGRVKCEQYWPESDDRYGPFVVTSLEQNICADYTIRKFMITNTMSQDEEPFQVTQLHFTSWPDHGVPAHSSPLLSFHRLVNSYQSLSVRPFIVHCSAGVGRTGTYITLDSMLDQIDAEGLVDIDGVIVKARNQRMKMVQTKDQYIFIHDTICSFITCGDTQISLNNFSKTLEELDSDLSTHHCTGYQHQFNILGQVSPNPDEIDCYTALKHPNKNRGNKYLPVETFRVALKDEQPNYIHAVTVDGYKQKKAYIIAQNPLKSTIRNFWKVITDQKCGVVIMLTHLEENNEEVCAQYWLNEGSRKFGEFTVKMVEEEKMLDFAVRKFIIESTEAVQEREVVQFQVTNWSPDGTCSNVKVLTDIIEEVAKVQRATGNNPILVHCSDTVSRSGMFCAIYTSIDRCKTEGVVDVFQVVKALRIHKPGAVLNVEQYKLIHVALLVYLQSFDTYANFKDVM